MATTPKGVPYPMPADSNDVPAHVQDLAEWIDVFALLLAARGAVGGVAALGADGKVPAAQLPADSVASVQGRAGVVTLDDLFSSLGHAHTAASIVSGVLATARLGSGVPGSGKYVDGFAGAWTALPSTLPLARVAHNPDPLTTYTKNSASSIDLDAANLVITFTGPPSGFVYVDLEAFMLGNTGAGWSLRDGATNIVGSGLAMSNNTSVAARQHYRVRLAVTPGTNYTWKWAVKSKATISLYAGGSPANEFGGGTGDYYGPAVMEVWSA